MLFQRDLEQFVRRLPLLQGQVMTMEPHPWRKLVCSCALSWVFAACHSSPLPESASTEETSSAHSSSDTPLPKDSDTGTVRPEDTNETATQSDSAPVDSDSASASESENEHTGCLPDTQGTDPSGTDTTTEPTDSLTIIDTQSETSSFSDSMTLETDSIDDTSSEDSDTGSNSASNTQTDDSDTAVACPEEMILLSENVCMDRYEASRPDASATSAGVDESAAHSRAGVLPWYVNPMTTEALTAFAAACESAGKRLCTSEEWSKACAGPSQSTYFFGNTWNSSVCNSVDTYCQECCDILGLETCPTGENCGYSSSLTSYPYEPETCFVTQPYSASSCHVCFHVMPTGAFPSCTNELGLFDVNGNVWEVVPVPTNVDSRGYQVRGGAFNCGSPLSRFRCSFNATWSALYAGFRCCKDRS
jgi:hypothetical protein